MPTERSAPSRSHTTNASVVSSFWMRTIADLYTGSGESETSALFQRSLDLVECRNEELDCFALAPATLAPTVAGEVVLLGRIITYVVQVAPCEPACRPERQLVAFVERLADHRDVRARHRVERGPLVRP